VQVAEVSIAMLLSISCALLLAWPLLRLFFWVIGPPVHSPRAQV